MVNKFFKFKLSKIVIASIVLAVIFGGVPLILSVNYLWDVNTVDWNEWSLLNEAGTEQDNIPLTVKYPTKIMAGDESYDFEFIFTGAKPYSVTVTIPPELSVRSVFPPTALLDSTITDSGQMQFVLQWESQPDGLVSHISSQNTITQSVKSAFPVLPTGVTSSTVTNDVALVGNDAFPPVIDDRVTLSISNSKQFADHFTILGFDQFRPEYIILREKQIDSQKIGPIEIENTNRALWRRRMHDYFGILAIPLIVVLLGGFLDQAYERREEKKRQQQKLHTLRQKYHDQRKRFITGIRCDEDGNDDPLRKIFESLGESKKQIDSLEADEVIDSDFKLIKMVFDISQGSINAIGEVKDVFFSEHPKIWLGALNHASRNNSDLKKNGGFRRLVRLFPRDLLEDNASWECYNKLRKQIELRPSGDRNFWQRFPRQESGVEVLRIKTLSDIQLFPPHRPYQYPANAEDEKMWLFPHPAGFYYLHPLLYDIEENSLPVLIHGEVGSGRTALALHLTHYPARWDVLGGYFTTLPSSQEISRHLVEQLQMFCIKRPNYLMLLTNEERELLAQLLVMVLDKKSVLAKLSRSKNEVKERINNADSETEKIINLDALLELKLLEQAVRGAERIRYLPDVERTILFLAASLGFTQIRLGFDLRNIEYEGNLAEVMSWGQGSFTRVSIQQLFFRPILDSVWDDVAKKWGMAIQAWHWGQQGNREPLVEMFYERARALGFDIPKKLVADYFAPPKKSFAKLIAAAQENPRRLAQLWRHIIQNNPQAKQSTMTMIDQAVEAINRGE